jgi:hypothetical protein
VVYHSGLADNDRGTGGFSAFMLRYLENDLAVIIATNSGRAKNGTSPQWNRLSFDIAKLYLPSAPPPPVPLQGLDD